MKEYNVIQRLRNAVEAKIVPLNIIKVIERTMLNIPVGKIDLANSVYKEEQLKDPYIYVKLYAKDNRSIPVEITFYWIIDFYCEGASILEMEEINSSNVDSICAIINMWLVSKIEKIEYLRGDYISKTEYWGSNKYMSRRRLFERTTPFGRFGKKKLSALYQPWIEI